MLPAMSSDVLHSLQKERYISLETYRRNGTGVKTPVWFALMDDSLVVVTNGNSYKVKRLRRNTAIKVAACNVNGKKILGPFHEGTGEIVEDSAAESSALGALKKKYGLQWRIFAMGSRLAGRRKDWLVLRLRF